MPKTHRDESSVMLYDNNNDAPSRFVRYKSNACVCICVYAPAHVSAGKKRIQLDECTVTRTSIHTDMRYRRI